MHIVKSDHWYLNVSPGQLLCRKIVSWVTVAAQATVFPSHEAAIRAIDLTATLTPNRAAASEVIDMETGEVFGQ